MQISQIFIFTNDTYFCKLSSTFDDFHYDFQIFKGSDQSDSKVIIFQRNFKKCFEISNFAENLTMFIFLESAPQNTESDL